MQRKYKAGSLSEVEWKIIEEKWKDFEYRWDLHPKDESTYFVASGSEDFESLEDFDDEAQSLLKWLYPSKKPKLPNNNTNSEDKAVYDSDKKLAKKISKFRKEQEFKLKYPKEYHHKYDKCPWLHDYKLPKATGRIISTRHDDPYRISTACYFRRNHKINIPLEVYFKSLILDREEILDSLDRYMGIYLLINNINNKIYIGSSIDLPQRIKHYMNLSKEADKERPIVKAINKYGIENFSLGILFMEQKRLWLEKDNWKKLLLDHEQRWINFSKPQYNENKALKIPLED